MWKCWIDGASSSGGYLASRRSVGEGIRAEDVYIDEETVGGSGVHGSPLRRGSPVSRSSGIYNRPHYVNRPNMKLLSHVL